jgi:hypothetical protein
MTPNTMLFENDHGHTVIAEEWGNTKPSSQCDGSTPHGDGIGNWIREPE